MNKLEAGLSELGIDAAPEQLRRLSVYISELELWNRKLNLVSFREHDELLVRHILDSLSALSIIRELGGVTLADVGSGAGLPGMLLAIFMEDHEFTLIERSGKKAGFLKTAAALLGIADRVEILDRDIREVGRQFDIVTLRAFREFGDFYKSLTAVTKPGGTIAAYKGKAASIERDLLTAGLDKNRVQIRPLNVPYLDEQRNLVLIEKK